MARLWQRLGGGLLGVVVLTCACADKRSGGPGTEITASAEAPDAQTSPDEMTDGAQAGAGAGGAGGGSSAPRGGSDAASSSSEPCRPVWSREAIPNRMQAVMFDGGDSRRAIFTRDLFSIFKTHCGACHVDTNLGDFQVKEASLFADDTADWSDVILSTMESDDPDEFMPPPDVGGIPYSERPEGDPIKELASLLQTWFDDQSPQDLFYMPTASVETPGYRLSEQVATSLTNMGSCVPNKSIVGDDTSAMDESDRFFSELDELPPLLSQTDLITFDTEALARRRVIPYAPTYPLFSDSARKMRHVRVPRGQTLAFDADTQQFMVPANTRFYKTFFKRINDTDGNERYKKIETRLIVSRPDGADGPNGEHETHALFGTYMWNDSETEAFLITDPLRNGAPFRDRLITYVTDEKRAQEILAADPDDKVVALQEGGAVRSYAIPGSDRCVQCHMGSLNGSFALGLTPLQLRSRVKGEGGVIEAVGPDELNQLRRFIDYGVISGLDDLGDVVLLEDSQGDRKPRNAYELTAQGYMLGNCAGCHNPRGFPTTQNPELKDLLNLAPSEQGGVFQFPLERVSPRIRRGLGQDIDIPYISPSLIDYSPTEHYMQKWTVVDDAAVYLAAPWRSLIYRNIDTPFPYSEDYALFPHMPMNAPGFDCRAPRIFGDWMVSIPAKRIVPEGTPLGPDMQPILPTEGTMATQPYVEVKPEDPDYEQALADADKRLATYHGDLTEQERDEFTNSPPDLQGRPQYTAYLAGYRSRLYCPDTSDIVDPNVRGDVLVPRDYPGSSLPSLYHDLYLAGDDNQDASAFSSAAVKFANQGDGVPDMPHWVVTDITDSTGDWYPRRTDWDQVLVTREAPPLDPAQERAVDFLQERKLTEAFRKFALEKHAFALWDEKPECDLSGQPSVGSFSGAERLRWMDREYLGHPAPSADAHVYSQSWGEAIYNEVCVNCHGPGYDSRGRQADTLMIMTGGDTRVANFKAGLFGPADAPHANVERIFQPFASSEVSADDWAARYAAWMGLGGTARKIPPEIMNVVATIAVFGERRPGNLDLTQSGANMLSIAATLCEHVLGLRRSRAASFDPNTGMLATREPADISEVGAALLDINADYEMWLEVCSYDNPPPVRVVQPRDKAWSEWQLHDKPVSFFIWGGLDQGPTSWYRRETYPAGSAVGDQVGRTQSELDPSNVFPFCVVKPVTDNVVTQTNDLLIAGDYVAKVRRGRPLPYCPQDWLLDQSARMTLADIDDWTTRGAINAGFAVYLYLDELARASREGGKPQPAFDRCEQLAR